MKKYQIIYSDPPWKFNNKNTGGSMISGSANNYNCMTVDEICMLPVWKVRADNCVLFMWWVGSMPDEALRVVRSWGFRLITMTGFTWVKKTVSGKPHFGMGFWTRAGSENCLIAVRGNPKKINASIRSVVEHEILSYSTKPDIFRDLIVNLVGDVPRLEMFARKNVDGWDAFGDEVEFGEVF